MTWNSICDLCISMLGSASQSKKFDSKVEISMHHENMPI